MNASVCPHIDAAMVKRFWSKVDKTGDCWEWRASLDPGGYGCAFIGKGHTFKAHRISWMILKGEIPQGLFVLHKCDNRKCVNPYHLFLGTIKDNVQDALSKGRIPLCEKHWLAKLTNADVLEIIRLRGKVTQPELAKRFNVSKSAISHIYQGKNWKGLTKEP